MGRLRVFIACSLDGVIAAEDHDLSWLPVPGDGDDDAGYGAFTAEIGAVLVGRTTFDVIGMSLPESPWGGRPTLVLNHQPLPAATWQPLTLVDERRAHSGLVKLRYIVETTKKTGGA